MQALRVCAIRNYRPREALDCFDNGGASITVKVNPWSSVCASPLMSMSTDWPLPFLAPFAEETATPRILVGTRSRVLWPLESFCMGPRSRGPPPQQRRRLLRTRHTGLPGPPCRKRGPAGLHWVGGGGLLERRSRQGDGRVGNRTVQEKFKQFVRFLLLVGLD